jgi:hypothetical protein
MNTEDLIKEAKARFHHNYQKIQLSQKYNSKLLFASQGGLWAAGPELFGTLHCLTSDEVVLLDNYKNPVKIKRDELRVKAIEVYEAVMREWHAEYESLKNNR